ncbi:hypothetical protein, partial [Promicromonospora sp. NPDC023987]|uniref:hypothetical protein n=1 Tax=Promicromonospora sp. NPDC023987 TaxID=3155360 RepID=UPI0033E37261
AERRAPARERAGDVGTVPNSILEADLSLVRCPGGAADQSMIVAASSTDLGGVSSSELRSPEHRFCGLS